MRILAYTLGLFLIGALPCLCQTPLIDQQWGGLFTLRQSDNGDTFSVGAVCSDQSNIYVYDLAGDKVIRFDASGKLAKIIKLEHIGHDTYSGDDFVVKDNEFIFLNTIDKRLDFFSTATGAHLRTLNFPVNFLAEEKKRSRMIITRIFVDNGTVYIGNEHVAVSIETTLAKKSATKKTLNMSNIKRIALVSGGRMFTTTGSMINVPGHSSSSIPKTHYPIQGKRFVLLNDQVFALTLSHQGLKLIKIQ